MRASRRVGPCPDEIGSPARLAGGENEEKWKCKMWARAASRYSAAERRQNLAHGVSHGIAAEKTQQAPEGAAESVDGGEEFCRPFRGLGGSSRDTHPTVLAVGHNLSALRALVWCEAASRPRNIWRPNSRSVYTAGVQDDKIRPGRSVQREGATPCGNMISQ